MTTSSVSQRTILNLKTIALFVMFTVLTIQFQTQGNIFSANTHVCEDHRFRAGEVSVQQEADVYERGWKAAYQVARYREFEVQAVHVA